jgi:phage-related protein (TIGR01555 family)
MAKRKNKGIDPKNAARAFLSQTGTPQASGAKDMYANPVANIGFGSTSQVNGGYYVPYRISLDYQELLHIYRGSWIARAVVDTIPQDMLKAFPTLTCELSTGDISDFDLVVQTTHTLQKMVEAAKWGRLFGGCIAIIILAGEDQKDLTKPLELDDVQPDSYRGLIVVDRWSGCSPSSELVSDINNPADYGLPMYYDVTTEVQATFRVHYTRVLRFTGRDLPLFERQIQTYWTMSELEAILEELRRRDFTASGIADLVSRAHVLVMKEPMLAQIISGLNLTQQQTVDYANRMSAVSQSISTNGILAIGADGGENSEVYPMSYSFGGLSDIYQTFMLDIAGACGIPVSRLYGRSITGLGQSGEGDLQVYYDTIDQKRNHELRPLFDKLIPIILMSTLGEVPEDLDYNFAPIRTMNAKERADLAKNTIDPLIQLYNTGKFSPKWFLQEIKGMSDDTGIGTYITEKDINAASDEPDTMAGMPDGPGGGEGGESQSGTPPTGGPDEDSAPNFRIAPAGKGKTKGAKDADGTFNESDHSRDEQGMFALAPGQSTEDKYRDSASGAWGNERRALHDEILRRIFEGRTAGGKPPQAHLLGGGSASGKSTGFDKLHSKKFTDTTLRVDSDALKEHLPEYADLKAQDPENAAARVQEESSHLAKRALAAAMKQKLDLIYDSTGSSANLPSIATDLKAHGYENHATFFDIPIDEARKRAARTGRAIPEDVLQSSHHGSAAGFMRLKDHPAISSATLYNNSGASPERVYKSDVGGETVSNEDAWKRYQKKAGMKNG